MPREKSLILFIVSMFLQILLLLLRLHFLPLIVFPHRCRDQCPDLIFYSSLLWFQQSNSLSLSERTIKKDREVEEENVEERKKNGKKERKKRKRKKEQKKEKERTKDRERESKRILKVTQPKK